jgi:putative Mg2+ transporter-C (MgtC) family protein
MITWQEVLLRLFLAAVFGGCVGIDRQRHEWAAGLRTHMLVCMGSALVMIVSAYGFRDVLPEDHVTLDPSRVAAQVISGIGFLGAGTILFLKHEVVKGLTTAAGLWTVAGIGLATGGGLYFAASATTVLVLIILIVLKPYKKKLTVERLFSEVHLKINRQLVSLAQVEQILNTMHIDYNHIRMNTTELEQICSIEIRFDEAVDHKEILSLVETLNSQPGISDVDYKPGVV